MVDSIEERVDHAQEPFLEGVDHRYAQGARAGESTKETCRNYGISEASFLQVRGQVRRDGRTGPKRLRSLAAENGCLKRLLAWACCLEGPQLK